MQPRALLATALLFVVSLVLGLGLAEIGLRASGYDPLLDLRSGREAIIRASRDPELRYELIPGASGRAWGTRVTINSSGYRGYEGERGPFEGFRILVVGDSIAFGNLVPDQSTFSARLHHRLNESDDGFEVLNFGVGGYDTVQEVALLGKKGLAYRPDLVILAYCLNDTGIVSYNLEYIELALGPLSHLRSTLLFALGIRTFQHMEWQRQKNDPDNFRREYEGQITPIQPSETRLLALMSRASLVSPSLWYRDRDRIGRLRYAFGRLRDLSDEGGFPVLVVIVPWLVGDEATYPHRVAHEIVKMEAARAGFQSLDLLDPFLRVGMKKLRAADRAHPNERGHSVIADVLYEYVRALPVREERSAIRDPHRPVRSESRPCRFASSSSSAM